jgi:hypothetical protein
MAVGCTPHYYYPYPTQQQTQSQEIKIESAEPVVEEVVVSCWPELTLIGLHPTKVKMVRAEFINQGWDPAQIKTKEGGSKNKVRAIVTCDGFVDIPTSDRVLVRGLCSTQKGAIRGMVNCHRCDP